MTDSPLLGRCITQFISQQKSQHRSPGPSGNTSLAPWCFPKLYQAASHTLRFRRGLSFQYGTKKRKNFGGFAVGRPELQLRRRSQLQRRTGHDSAGVDGSGRAYSPGCYSRKSAGGPDLDCQQWRDQLSRKAGHRRAADLTPKWAAPTAASYTDTGLTNGTTYFYVVSALNASGESTNSEPGFRHSGLTRAGSPPPDPPAVPTALAATAGNQQISLSWTASTGATSYHVKRATTSGGPYTQVAAPTGTSYVNTGLTNGTTYFYVVSALNATGESANSSQASATPAAAAAADVTITVDPTKTKPISPWIYGLNFYTGVSGAPPHLTLDRAGGNRWTAYNWETNASNAGSDFLYENDSFLTSSTTPAEAVRSFVAADQSLGMASVMTVQLQGLVSADESGPVSTSNPPDLTRFKQVIDKKSTITPAAFTETPSTSDANVYMDEFLWTMDQKIPGIFGANAPLPTFVSLDNEPELWNSTHLEVQGHNPVSSDNYIAKTITLTKALKDQFPGVMIFGPVHYGFQGIYNWQGELSASPDGANWFPDKYLPAIKTASDAYGKPLVDVYDFHWYSEATDGSTRVTNLTGSTLDRGASASHCAEPAQLVGPDLQREFVDHE